MQTNFILRLLTADRRVLAWTKLVGETRGDGAIWPTQDFVAEADETGTGVSLSVHWPEVHVHQTAPLSESVHVDKGKVVSLSIRRSPLIRIASEDTILPPVTEHRSMHIGVPVAASR